MRSCRPQSPGLQAAVAGLQAAVAAIGRQILGLAERLEDMGGELGGLRLELAYRNHAYGYFGSLLKRAASLDSDQLAALLGDAVDNGRLTDDEAREVALAAVLVTGKESGEVAYLVVEVSRSIGSLDVKRAARRAALLFRAGHRARGVVAGEKVIGRVTDEAVETGIAVILDGRKVA